MDYERAYHDIAQLARGPGAAQAIVGLPARPCPRVPYTKSEIVVPILAGTKVIGEIDIDGSELNAFGPDDQRFLQRVAGLLAHVREKQPVIRDSHRLHGRCQPAFEYVKVPDRITNY